MIQITKRDLMLLRWINALGFVEIDHVAEKLAISRRTAYQRIKKLIERGLLVYEKVLFYRPGAYRVTRAATQLTGDLIPPLRKISVTTYLHDAKVVTASLALERQYSAKFVSERLLRHRLGSTGVGQKGHLSDGALVWPDKRVAIEVELSVKGQSRLEKIFNHHLKNFDFNEVWYFCGNQAVHKKLRPWQEKSKIIRVHLLSNLIQEGASDG